MWDRQLRDKSRKALAWTSIIWKWKLYTVLAILLSSLKSFMAIVRWRNGGIVAVSPLWAVMMIYYSKPPFVPLLFVSRRPIVQAISLSSFFFHFVSEISFRHLSEHLVGLYLKCLRFWIFFSCIKSVTGLWRWAFVVFIFLFKDCINYTVAEWIVICRNHMHWLHEIFIELFIFCLQLYPVCG